jgi:hypothetical protein
MPTLAYLPKPTSAYLLTSAATMECNVSTGMILDKKNKDEGLLWPI